MRALLSRGGEPLAPARVFPGYGRGGGGGPVPGVPYPQLPKALRPPVASA